MSSGTFAAIVDITPKIRYLFAMKTLEGRVAVVTPD
jgi:hypothetical protein